MRLINIIAGVLLIVFAGGCGIIASGFGGSGGSLGLILTGIFGLGLVLFIAGARRPPSGGDIFGSIAAFVSVVVLLGALWVVATIFG